MNAAALRRFALSFAVVGLLAAPLVLTAMSPPGPDLDGLSFSGAAGPALTLDGVELKVTVVRQKTGELVARVEGHNTTDKAVSGDVVVALMANASASRMSRVMPRPSQIGDQVVTVQLAPGAKFSRTIVFENTAIKSPPSPNGGFDLDAQMLFLTLAQAPAAPATANTGS